MKLLYGILIKLVKMSAIMPKFYNIDPETCTKEELLQAIEACQDAENEYHDQEQACKIFLNSCYGALANQFYQCSNLDIAESITLQGQDLIKFSSNAVDYYFKELWHKDTEVHGKIAAAMKEKFPSFDTVRFLADAQKPVVFDSLIIYNDTDSAYATLQPIQESCSIPLEMQTDFDVNICKYILEDYMDLRLNEYAKKYNCKENLEKFELEKISRTVLMIAKKKYCMDICWLEGNIFLPSLHKLVIKGIEMIQGSTPEWCRNEMKEFLKFMLGKVNQGETVQYEEIIQKLKQMKQRFALQNPNEISKTFKLSDYEKFILEDKKEILYTDAVCPIHVRGAALYNHMLYNDAKKYRSKYSIAKKGDKVKFYYINSDDVFSFIPNEYPIEFAPKVDIDTQFEKILLEPLNRIIEAIGYPKVSASLTYSSGLW